MEETFDIKIVHRHKINKLGNVVIACGAICFFILLIFSAPYRIMGMGIDMVPIELNFATLISIVIILIGIILKVARKNEPALMALNASEIIIENKRILRKIKFDEIIRFEGKGLDFRNITFKIITQNGNDIEIKTNKEIYEGFIGFFPEKE